MNPRNVPTVPSCADVAVRQPARASRRAAAIAALLVIALLALAPAAEATKLMGDSIDAARAYWGQDVPCLDIQLDRGGRGYLARAELGADRDGDGDVEQGCKLTLTGRWFATNPRVACETLAHEWGHLLGHGHPRDGSIMDPLRLRRAGLVPQCRRVARAARLRKGRACRPRARSPLSKGRITTRKEPVR